MPRVLPRPHRPKPDHTRLLALLGQHLLKHGCTAEQIGELVQAGLATATVERAVAGGRTIEIARMRINAARLLTIADTALSLIQASAVWGRRPRFGRTTSGGAH